MAIELKSIMTKVSYGKTWKGLATIQRNLEEHVCRVTFNSNQEIKKYLATIASQGLSVQFYNEGN